MAAKVSKSQLAQFTPLDALNPENLSEIAAKLEVIELKTGKYVFREGDIIKQHFYLLDGEVDILAPDKSVVGTVAGGRSSVGVLRHRFQRGDISHRRPDPSARS